MSHTPSRDMPNSSSTARPQPGDRVHFDGKRTSWLARASTRNGRYLLCTSVMFGNVYYTIIDFEQHVRGAMNIIGHGLGIYTKAGADPAIDRAIAMLEESEWTISHRNQVPLDITNVRAAAL